MISIDNPYYNFNNVPNIRVLNNMKQEDLQDNNPNIEIQNINQDDETKNNQENIIQDENNDINDINVINDMNDINEEDYERINIKIGFLLYMKVEYIIKICLIVTLLFNIIIMEIDELIYIDSIISYAYIIIMSIYIMYNIKNYSILSEYIDSTQEYNINDSVEILLDISTVKYIKRNSIITIISRIILWGLDIYYTTIYLKSCGPYKKKINCDIFKEIVFLFMFTVLMIIFIILSSIIFACISKIINTYINIINKNKLKNNLIKYTKEITITNNLLNKIDIENQEITDCTICLIGPKNKEIWRKLNCGHIYHIKCIDNWINKNIVNPTCPNCRTNIFND
jgi:hypothetical protein